ncbi:MAG TPA: hypothetical protein DD413_07580 [Ruminococcus sp.]|nr:hypothetical protein [Ruminococcus sp.]
MDFSCIISRANSICETKGIDKRIYTKSGAGKDFVSNIKKGSAPSIEKVYALADYLDCSVDYLLGRTDNPQSHKNSSSVSVGSVQGNSGAIGVGNTVTNPAAPLDEHQKLLLELYNKLPPIEQVELISDLHNRTK